MGKFKEAGAAQKPNLFNGDSTSKSEVYSLCRYNLPSDSSDVVSLRCLGE